MPRAGFQLTHDLSRALLNDMLKTDGKDTALKDPALNFNPAAQGPMLDGWLQVIEVRAPKAADHHHRALGVQGRVVLLGSKNPKLPLPAHEPVRRSEGMDTRKFMGSNEEADPSAVSSWQAPYLHP